jgi:hypothetical protein
MLVLALGAVKDVVLYVHIKNSILKGSHHHGPRDMQGYLSSHGRVSEILVWFVYPSLRCFAGQ